jgi:hypothetical protein
MLKLRALYNTYTPRAPLKYERGKGDTPTGTRGGKQFCGDIANKIEFYVAAADASSSGAVLYHFISVRLFRGVGAAGA